MPLCIIAKTNMKYPQYVLYGDNSSLVSFSTNLVYNGNML